MKKYFCIKYFYFVILLLFIPSLIQAQGFYFGRNKIQYHDFNWHILKTQHFDIYYYPEMRELAQIGANYAEVAYKYLQNRMNHSISRRIPLIFYSSHFHFQQTNILPMYLPEGIAGFFEHMKGRVVVPCDGSISSFRKTIRHELVHVFMFSKINRIQRDHRTTLRTSPPFWFTEGLADYWSRDMDTQAEMVMRDLVMSNRIVPLPQIHTLTGSFLAYKEGESILRYIEEKYGPEKVLMLMENFWRSDKFSKVLKFVIGKDYRELGEDWLYYLKKKHYPLMKDNEYPKMAADRITQKGYNNSPVYYIEDGVEKIIFVSNRTGYTDLCKINLLQYGRKEKNYEVLIKGERSEEFESFHYLKSRIDVNKNGLLTFISRNGDTDALYIFSLKSGKVENKFKFKNIVAMSSPQWSPDNKKMAFSGIDMSGRSDIFVYNIPEKKLIRITDDFYEDKYPTWAPDNRTIAFSSDRVNYNGKSYFNLFTADYLTKSLNHLTKGAYNDDTPNWSKNGDYIVFLSDRDKVNNIWLMNVKTILFTDSDESEAGNNNLAGGNNGTKENLRNNTSSYTPGSVKQVTHFITGAYDPSWINDKGLVFTTFENLSFQIQKLDNIIETYEQTAEEFPGLPEDAEVEPREIKKIKVTGQKKPAKYEKKFSLDVAQGQVGQDPLFGTSGGAQIVITDMLGDDQAYFLLYNNSQTKDDFLKSFNFVFNRLSIFKKKTIAYGVYHFTGRRYTITDYDYDERLYGGFFTIRYPISFFRRIEFTANLNRSDKEWYFSNKRRKAIQVSGFASYVWDNTAWGNTGPIDGMRFNVTLGHTHDIKWDNVSYYTVYADFRKYFRLTSRISLAVRAMTHYNEGKEARRHYFGGSWDMRLYKRFGMWGEKIAFTSTELRFPLIDMLGIRFPFVGLGFSRIRGALFFDAGNAWNKDFGDMKGSFGIGARMNFGGFLVLRYDMGRRIENNFNSISSGTHHQFFFGWDF